MKYISTSTIGTSLIFAFSAPAFAEPTIFDVQDSRGNSYNECMIQRQNIVDVRPCEPKFGDSNFDFDKASRKGPIKIAGKCLGLNKIRNNIWSLNSPVGLMDCNNQDVIVIEWELANTQLVATNSPTENKLCLGIHPRYNKIIALGECDNPSTLPRWIIRQTN